MSELVGGVFVLLVGCLLLISSVRGHTPAEQRLMTLSFLAHILATLAQIAITRGVYEGGDMLTYMKEGAIIARAFEIDPARFGALWLDLLLQREPNESLPVLGAGHATGTMVAFGAVLSFVFREGLFPACLTVATAACFGKFALYRAFRETLPETSRRAAAVGTLLVPSAVFWSSGLLKEAFVMAGIGPFWLGVHRIIRGRVLFGAILVALGAIPIGLLKPYTLFALAVASGVWFGIGRLQQRAGGRGPVRIRPLYIVLGGLVVYGGVIALGQVFPTYSVENLGQDFARHQGLGVAAGGGSYYQMGDGEAMSLQKQIAFAPLAVGTSLFRPFPFEANNALAFVASLEVLALAILLVRTLTRKGLRAFGRALMSSPVLVAGLVFALSFGMAVGLATTNFGSLSRYRMPLMPFYATVILALGTHAKARPLASARQVANRARIVIPAARGAIAARGARRR